MPQMKPMNWLFLMFYNILLLFIVNYNLFYLNYNYIIINNNNNNLMMKFMKFNLKW